MQMSDRQRKVFGSLLNNPADFNMCVERMHNIVMASFYIDAKVLGENNVHITEMSVRHRMNICLKWFEIMRGDMKYTLHRTLDTLSEALAAELLGQPFDPKDRREGGMWTAYETGDPGILTE